MFIKKLYCLHHVQHAVLRSNTNGLNRLFDSPHSVCNWSQDGLVVMVRNRTQDRMQPVMCGFSPVAPKWCIKKSGLVWLPFLKGKKTRLDWTFKLYLSSITLPDSSTPASPPIHGLVQACNDKSHTSSQEQTLDIDNGNMPHDEHDNGPVYTHGRLPGYLIDKFNKGFQQVTKIFSKLGESRRMPWQQVKDHYNRQYSCSNSQNLWNIYSVYFMKNMQAEIGRAHV